MRAFFYNEKTESVLNIFWLVAFIDDLTHNETSAALLAADAEITALAPVLIVNLVSSCQLSGRFLPSAMRTRGRPDDHNDSWLLLLLSLGGHNGFAVLTRLVVGSLPSFLLISCFVLVIKSHPSIEAATQQPTRQSNQWLSALSGRTFHSSHSRPRPSVRTAYSLFKCLASVLCSRGLARYSVSDPEVPGSVANRAIMNDFQ